MKAFKNFLLFAGVMLFLGCATKIEGRYSYTFPNAADSKGVDVTVEFKRDGNAVVTRKYNTGKIEERSYPANWTVVDGVIEVWYLTKNPPMFLSQNDDGTLTVLNSQKEEYQGEFKEMMIMKRVD
ncbi:MAG: hypothetical protein CR988_02865 [Treponema sp.]|nr:MAG: hypothetical protein CR988_02865 [Treponema sp.]